MDDDPTLPIDFDQTSNFARFLNQSNKDIMQNITTFNEPKSESTAKKKDSKKQRSYSSNDQPPERPLSRGSIREQENLISELKKECFGLKMRIYFMEEQLSEAYNGDTDGIMKKNIELKVTIEEIKNDLQEKSDLLTQASAALEHMSLQKDNYANELQEKSHQLENLKEKYETEIEDKEEEIRRLHSENEALKLNNGIATQKELEIKNMQNSLKEIDQKYKELEQKKKNDEESLKSLINELEEAAAVKDANIQSLKRSVENLADSPERSSQHYRKLYESQTKEIAEKDQRINSLIKDVASKTNLSEGLKEHIVNMEKSIKSMRSNLHEKEMDKQRVVNQLQDKIKHSQSKYEDKEKEVATQCDLVERLENNLKRLSRQRIQFQLDSVKEKDARLVELDVKIKQQSFEIENLKALLEDKDKEIVYFNKKNLHLEDKMKKHQFSSSESLKVLKNDFGAKILNHRTEKEELLENFHILEGKYNQQIKRKDKTLLLFGDTIKQKDDMVKSLVEMTKDGEDNENDTLTAKDKLIEKLQLSVRQMEKQLEDYKEEMFTSSQLIEEEKRELQKDLRSKTNLLKTSEGQLDHAKIQIEGLQRSLKNNKAVTDKLKTSLERTMESERESQLKSGDLLREKEQAISRLSSHLQVKNKQLEFLEKLWQDLYTKVPNEMNNDDVGEMLKSLNTTSDNDEKLLPTNWNGMIAVEIKNQELLSMLKEKENNIKELYQMLRYQEEEKDRAFEALNEKLLNTAQDVQVLSSSLLALKDIQQAENKNIEESLTKKSKMIDDLIKAGKEKDRLICDLKENSKMLRSSSPTKSAEVNKLRDQVNKLRTMLDDKIVEKEECREEIENLRLQLSKTKNETTTNDTATKKRMEELEDHCHSLEDEKIQLQAELGLAKLTNESLENQLEGAHSRLSRQGTPDYKDSLMEELEDLVKAAEKEKAKYQTLAEKLQNNQHPESCLKLLKNEITEVEHLRRSLQGILLNVLKKQPGLDSLHDIANNENKQLKLNQLKSPDMTSIIKDIEMENQSLKNDLKRCEIEVKQLNAQIDLMKNEYEQLIHERDQEISHMTSKLEELVKDKDILIKQRNQAKEDLITCHKQLDMLSLRVNEQSESKQDLEEVGSVTGDKEINMLHEENSRLKSKLTDAENDLKHLNETLMHMREVDIASLESKQHNVLEEKKQLKKDAKELCNINDRLRSKLKDVTKSYEILKSDKETEQTRLVEEIQKGRQTISELEENLRKRQNTFDEEKGRLVENTREKDYLYDEVKSKYEATLDENATLQRKVEELINVNEFQQTLTAPELQQLRDEVLQLTKENNKLKIEKLQYDGVQKETNTLISALEESRHRSKALQDELLSHDSKVRLLQNKVNDQGVRLKVNDENVRHVERLENDLRDMKKLKELLERQLKELSNSVKDMKEQVSLSRDEISAKEKMVTTLRNKLDELARERDSFSPIQTSSQQNIIISTDSCTQTYSVPKENKQGVCPNDSSLISIHIEEMRELRKQLEETRKNNDNLRQQLEDRLLHVEREARMLNDPKLKATLIRDNDAIRVKLSQAEANQERMKIRIDELETEKQNDQTTIEQLHLQLHELNQMSTNLKLEMDAYDRLVKQFGISRKSFQDGKEEGKDSDKLDKHLMMALLEEIRDLRLQLTKSIDVNIALREKLENELGRPVSISPLVTPSKDPTMSAKRSLFSAVLQSVSINDGDKEVNETRKARVHFGSPFETPTKDGSYLGEDSSSASNESSRNLHQQDICILFGTWTDYRFILSQTEDVIASLRTLLKQSSTIVSKHPSRSSFLMRYSGVDLNSNLKKLEEINRLLHSFIPQDDKQSNLTEENTRLRKDIARMKKVLSSKEHFIQSALKMVEENALWKGKQKEDASITKKLLKARDTLKATKGNLELKAKKAQETASIDASFMSSSSFEEAESPN